MGYRNEQFFSIFNLLKADSTECQFYNVWVFDNKPLNVDSAGILSTSCTTDPRTVFYKDKIRRFPEYQDKNPFIGNAIAANPNDLKVSATVLQVNECKTNCSEQADYWIATLSKCTTDPGILENIRLGLIEVCSQGCERGQVNGASSFNYDETFSRTFEDVIRDYLGPNAINDSCTQELLGMPFPFGKEPKYSQKLIDVTDYDICSRISQFQLQYNSSGFGGSFHQYLQQILPNDYILTETELTDLLRSCTSCNGILNYTIALPTAFELNAPACLTCSTATSIKALFDAKFHGITVEDNPRYETLFTNFFNHTLGFSLGFLDYQDFFARCAQQGYTGSLCNQSLNPLAITDTNYENSCMSSLFSTALSIASEEYTVYIDSVRKEFRDAYMAKCLSVAPRLGMTADLYEYHYTLYYYDQSGNLVKTIPPKGVVLLTETQIQDVQRYRFLTSEGCFRYSDSVRLSGSGYLQFPLAGNPTIQPFTLEAYINPSTLSDQVLFAKLLAGTGSQGAYSTGYVLQIKNQKLILTFKSLGPGQLPIQVVAESQDISGILNTSSWNYIAFGRTGNGNAPGMINVNGRPLLLTYTENAFVNYKPLSLDGQDLVIGKYPSGMPGGNSTDYFTGTIKNVRVYDRLLSLSEISQNAFSLCQQAVSSNGLILWSLVNSAAGNIVSSSIGGSGTLYNTSWQAFAGVYPQHSLPTTYQYNSLNQVVKQSSPDGGLSQFWYDYIGRLVLSQNAKQASITANQKYSYTLYDNIGRIIEVGEKYQAAAPVTHALTLNKIALNNWLAAYQGNQITHTVYDQYDLSYLPNDLLHAPIYNTMEFSTSRKRVVASVSWINSPAESGSASYYHYDINGNVKTLWQENVFLNQVSAGSDGIKRIDYDYDLVSGKVNKVGYQPGKGDQFFHKYLYDAENRLTDVYTSRDELIWQQDAFYRYYLHGPLARTEIGQRKVQGIDYAYTLQGWIKGINGTYNGVTHDMGRDNYNNTQEYNHFTVSRDVFSYDLNYFNTDFRPIGSIDPSFRGPFFDLSAPLAGVRKPLYNGNINGMSVSLDQFGFFHYSYGYDQLNRLRLKRSFTDPTGELAETNDFSEFFQYDPNGNILSAERSASLEGAGGLNMDVLTYQYENNSNKLSHVTDLVPSSTHDYDVDGQGAQNYTYDQIGNLVADAQENITNINWSVYGKIYSITKINTPTNKQTFTQYSYDASGNRITKLVTQSAIGGGAPVITDRTLYVRDAQGNVMATYSKHEEAGQTPALLWAEQHLYGSSRLGVMNLQMEIPAQPMVPLDGHTMADSLHTGQYAYELTNHLGNVMATISDKKLFSNLTDPEGGTEPIYSAELLSQTDYYAFGQEIKDRSYRLNGTYRYGFNGKENDNEIKGEGNQQDYGMRIYDPRLGRFLSVDPISSKYPFYTPYQFAGNKPIQFVDIDGLEEGFNIRFEQMQRGYLKGNVTEKELNDFHKSNAFGALMGSAVLLTRGAILRYGPQMAWWAMNPSNQQMLVGIGGLTASLVDPNPFSDYPGSFDDLAKGFKLLFKSKGVEKFIFNTKRLNFFFGRGTDVQKSTQRLGNFSKLGINETEDGIKKLIQYADNALSSPATGGTINKETGRFEVWRTIQVEDNGKVKGSIQFGFSYADKSMTGTPELMTAIPQPIGK